MKFVFGGALEQCYSLLASRGSKLLKHEQGQGNLTKMLESSVKAPGERRSNRASKELPTPDILVAQPPSPPPSDLSLPHLHHLTCIVVSGQHLFKLHSAPILLFISTLLLLIQCLITAAVYQRTDWTYTFIKLSAV